MFCTQGLRQKIGVEKILGTRYDTPMENPVLLWNFLCLFGTAGDRVFSELLRLIAGAIINANIVYGFFGFIFIS